MGMDLSIYLSFDHRRARGPTADKTSEYIFKEVHHDGPIPTPGVEGRHGGDGARSSYQPCGRAACFRSRRRFEPSVPVASFDERGRADLANPSTSGAGHLPRRRRPSYATSRWWRLPRARIGNILQTLIAWWVSCSGARAIFTRSSLSARPAVRPQFKKRSVKSPKASPLRASGGVFCILLMVLDPSARPTVSFSFLLRLSNEPFGQVFVRRALFIQGPHRAQSFQGSRSSALRASLRREAGRTTVGSTGPISVLVEHAGDVSIDNIARSRRGSYRSSLGVALGTPAERIVRVLGESLAPSIRDQATKIVKDFEERRSSFSSRARWYLSGRRRSATATSRRSTPTAACLELSGP